MLLISIYFDYIRDQRGNFFSKIFIVFIVVIGLSGLYDHFNSRSDDYITNRLSSIQDDGGSGRVDIYNTVFNSFEKQFFENKLMGVGHNGVRNSGIVWETRGVANQNLSSHNDFIEIIYDYGVIGIIIYLFFIKSVISNTLKIRKLDSRLFQANIVSLIMFLVMSMVSHLILYPTYFAYLVILWAITASYLHQNKANL
jgi:O-antigen ligase